MLSIQTILEFITKAVVLATAVSLIIPTLLAMGKTSPRFASVSWNG